jgi:uncharacterized protein (AIM24 family)/RNA polymerase subunit RPABC4/transcription elongation factor Spt4
MFCVNCGNQIRDDQNFCPGCGSPVKRAPQQPPAPAPPQSQAPVQAAPDAYAAAPPEPAPAVQSSSTAPPPEPAIQFAGGKCSWCGGSIARGQTSCPRCGAALSMPEEISKSGWAQLPGRKDMAKLQFGNSFCQIEGAYVPVADMKLAPEDSVYFTHHVLLWKDPQINITTMSMKGGWKRLFSGLPLIMTQAQGPGHIAFSKDDPGELIPVPLQAGQAIDVREHMFLVATGHVQYDWLNTGIWFTTQNGNDSETHYPIGMLMDRFSAPSAPGLLLLHAGGNIFVRELREGEAILVKPKALVFKDPSVRMQLHFEHPSAGIFGMWGSWGGRYLWLLLYGPGRVAIQSVFEPVEGEGGRITNSSYATRQQW